MQQDICRSGHSVREHTTALPGRGFRKLTPGMLAAEKLATTTEGTTLPPRHAARAAISTLVRAGRLSNALAQTMITLIDLCGTWEKEDVAIVFAGNRLICDRLGLACERSLRARLAQLAGVHRLICHEERPGGRRGVERDPETLEMRYYGISILPLIAQIDQIAALNRAMDEAYASRAKAARSLRSAHQRLSSLVSAALEAGFSQRAWLARLDHANDVLEASQAVSEIAALESYAETMRSALDQAKIAFDDSLDAREAISGRAGSVDKLSSSYTKDSGYPESRTPPETTNKDLTDKSEQCTLRVYRKRASRPAISDSNPAAAGCKGLENKPGGSQGAVNTNRSPKRSVAQLAIIEADLQKYGIGPDQLAEASELLHACLPYDEADDPTWRGIYGAATDLRPVIGMSDYAWRLAVETLGPKGASAAIAYATGSPAIKSAPAYVRSLTDIAAKGGILDLGQKLRKLGRLRDQAVSKAETMQ